MADAMERVGLPSEMWMLSADRRTLRMQVPETLVAGLPDPIRLLLEFDAASVDAMLQRLTELRALMLPPPRRH